MKIKRTDYMLADLRKITSDANTILLIRALEIAVGNLIQMRRFGAVEKIQKTLGAIHPEHTESKQTI